MSYKSLHLSISAAIIIIVALAYGTNPCNILHYIFNLDTESPDIKNFFKAIMGLYLSFSTYWIFGIIKLEHWRNATITNVVFMGGLSIGRIFSMLTDGLPSIILVVGLLIEIGLLFWGITNLKKYETR